MPASPPEADMGFSGPLYGLNKGEDVCGLWAVGWGAGGGYTLVLSVV